MNLIKVPAPASWLPIQPNLWIPRFYQTFPVFASENDLLIKCLNNFVMPPDYETNPYWGTKLGEIILSNRVCVTAQFIRYAIDKDFTGGKMPRHWKKTVKNYIYSQAKLMAQVWHVVRLLPSSRKPRPLVFHEINLEGELIFLNAVFEGEDELILSVTNLIKKQQNFNRILQSLKNPFEPNLAATTWSFVEECGKLAEISDDFRSDYLKLVKARMHFVAIWQQTLPRKFDQSGKNGENRGRKSISSSRTPSQ